MSIELENKDYQIIKPIGKGGMSTVYLAVEKSLKRDVAIKVLHSNLSGDPKNKERLRREALAIAKMNHDNIVKIYNFVEEELHSYIVMEYVDGSDLEDFMKEHPIHYIEIGLAIFLKISKALFHAHQTGIIHRDIKPENVMISKKGDIKVMDFGISSILGEYNNLTTTGSIMGSPMFMSPEHLNDFPIDHQSDIFSLGIVLYHLLTRDYPFKGKNTGQLLSNIAKCNYTNPQQKNKLIPNFINRILMKTLTKEREFRYQSLEEVIVDIEKYFKLLNFNVNEELTLFFKNPEGYQSTFSQTIIEKYLDRARLALSERSYSVATEYANLVLEYSNTNSDAFSIIRSIEKSKLLKKVIPLSVLTIALITIIIYGLSYLDNRKKVEKRRERDKIILVKKENQKKSKIEANIKKRKELIEFKNKSLKNIAIVNKELLNILKKVELKPIEKKVKIKYRKLQLPFNKPIRVIPKAASLYLNGKHYGYGNIKKLRLKTNKRYLLEIKSAGCEKEKIKLFFRKEDETPIVVRLKWKNAKLNIKNPSKYDIYIGNKYYGNFKTIEYFKRPDITSNGKTSVILKSKNKTGKIIFEEKITLIAGKISSKIIN